MRQLEFPIRLVRCDHGAYHLTVSGATLHLSETDLASVGGAIYAMANRHPTLLAGVVRELLETEQRNPGH